MEELNYSPTESYFGNSNKGKVIKTNNELMRCLEGDFSNSQNEYEVDIKNLFIKKYEKRNEILNKKPMLDIDTIESIRISHSLVRSENSQSLTDIINNPFIIGQRNSRDENFMNQTLKFKNSNTITENESSLSSNKSFDYNHYNGNIEEQNNLISIKDNKNSDINRKYISEINENYFNDNKKIQDINDKDESNDINNKCIKKNNIGNIFNKAFEEKIKLANKEIASTKEYLKEYDCLKNKNEIKQKLLKFENNAIYLNQIDSDKYSMNNKEKELAIGIKYYNKEREEKNNSISFRNRKNKKLIISSISSTNEYNEENMKKVNENEEKKDNKSNINKEKNNHLILDYFENEKEKENDSSKNVYISELDIKISNLTSKEENYVKDSPKEKTEVNKKINNTNDKECIKKKNVFLKIKNLNTDFNKNKRKPNNIINYIYKKAFKFNKNLDKIIEKKLCSYKNIRSFKRYRGKKIFNFENDISKKYKNNSPFSNCEAKTMIKKKNILNNSRSNFSFFELNNSILNRKNINNRTLNTERNNKNYSRILNTSISLPKNRKINKNYLNDLFKKKLYTISKKTHSIKNFFKIVNENKINQNNETKEQLSSSKKVYTHSFENKRKIYYTKLSKINTILFSKMNRTKDYIISSKFNYLHFNTIKNISHRKNLYNIGKNYISNKKKDFSLSNINKDKMLFKGKIKKIKKTDLYLNNSKILKRKNLNNFFKMKDLYRKLNKKNIQNSSVLLKNDIKIKNIINNSFTQNINLYNYKKPINNKINYLSKSIILTNVNNSKNLINQYKNTRSNEKIITEYRPINKYNTYIINHFINFKEPKINTNKKGRIINNKLSNKTNITYIKNITEKNNLLNCKTINKNTSELKYKINNILITINNSHKNILPKNKSPY